MDNIVRTASVLLFLTTEALVYIPLDQSSTISTVKTPLYQQYHHMLVKDVTHKVKVSVLRHLPVVGEDVLGLDVVTGLLLRLVVVVVLLLLGRLVGVLLVKIVHEGWTYRLLGGGVSCGGGRGLCFLSQYFIYIQLINIEEQKKSQHYLN